MCTNIIAGIRKGNQILIGGSDTIAEKFRQVILPQFGKAAFRSLNLGKGLVAGTMFRGGLISEHKLI